MQTKYYIFKIATAVEAENEKSAREQLVKLIYNGGDLMKFLPEDLELISVEDV